MWFPSEDIDKLTKPCRLLWIRRPEAAKTVSLLVWREPYPPENALKENLILVHRVFHPFLKATFIIQSTENNLKPEILK